MQRSFATDARKSPQSRKKTRLAWTRRVRRSLQSHRSGLNRRPLDYESSALPLSYCGVAALRQRHSSGLVRNRRRDASAPALPLCGGATVAVLFETQTRCVRAPSFIPCPGTDSNRDASRHHPLKMACLPISPPGHRTGAETAPERSCYLKQLRAGATGLEPATSRVTVECSNQTELRPHDAFGVRRRACGSTAKTKHGPAILHLRPAHIP